MSAAQWTNQTLTATVTVISADDVRDLRLKLDEALTALGGAVVVRKSGLSDHVPIAQRPSDPVTAM